MKINTNLLHNILNIVGLIVGAMITFDWGDLGLSPTQAATIAAGVLFADKVIKLGINITRDGLSGLIKNQPPVK